MKKFLGVAVLVAAFALMFPTAAQAQGWQPAQAAFSSLGTDTTVGAPAHVKTASSCKVFFLSTSTSSANLDLEDSPDGVTYFHKVVRAANPTSVGEVWTGPCGPHVRFNPSTHASGSLVGYIFWRSIAADPLGVVWKQVEVSSAGSAFSLTSATFATSSIFQQTTANYTLTWANPAGARAISIVDPGGTDVFVFRDMAQTLLNKTLTSPTMTAPVLGAATGTSVALTGTVTANHFRATVTVPPTVTGGASTCGTAAGSIAGGDTGGTVTVGSVGGTACVVTFGTTWTNVPACAVTREAVAIGDLVVTTTATNLTATATFGAGEKFHFACIGY
jgi:hypothetical protein